MNTFMVLKQIRSLPFTAQVIRRTLHSWFLLSRGLTLGVRAAVLDGERRVCLIRHTYVPGWQLPGGGLEVGEDALLALRRELREEAEIEVSGEPRLHGVFHNRHVSRRDHVLVFTVREFRILGPKRPDREIAEMRFFPLGGLPDGTTRGTRDRLAEIASGRVPPTVW